MKVVIPGGTGQVGVMLARSFQADGHEVVVLGRKPNEAAPTTPSCEDGEREMFASISRGNTTALRRCIREVAGYMLGGTRGQREKPRVGRQP
jgi:nucleoside-diphosphate-sugar epimerase